MRMKFVHRLQLNFLVTIPRAHNPVLRLWNRHMSIADKLKRTLSFKRSIGALAVTSCTMTDKINKFLFYHFS